MDPGQVSDNLLDSGDFFGLNDAISMSHCNHGIPQSHLLSRINIFQPAAQSRHVRWNSQKPIKVRFQPLTFCLSNILSPGHTVNQNEPLAIRHLTIGMRHKSTEREFEEGCAIGFRRAPVSSPASSANKTIGSPSLGKRNA
jgi:hypothetical protein